MTGDERVAAACAEIDRRERHATYGDREVDDEGAIAWVLRTIARDRATLGRHASSAPMGHLIRIGGHPWTEYCVYDKAPYPCPDAAAVLDEYAPDADQ